MCESNRMVSAEDMADAIGGIGTTARQAGIELDNLNGYVASIVSSTGLSGSEVGTALRGVISRLYRIGSEGESDAGKSEEVLRGIGVAVRDAAGEFRDFDDIMKDLNGKWSSLNKVTQTNIAQTIAGG